MNSRLAKKVYCYTINDTTKKQSAQSPYSYDQILRARRRFQKSLNRWKRWDPTMTGRPKWLPAVRTPGGTLQSLKRERVAWTSGAQYTINELATALVNMPST